MLLRFWCLRKTAVIPDSSPAVPAMVLGGLWLSSWAALDWWERQPEPQFFPAGLPLLAWFAMGILALSALAVLRSVPAPRFGTGLMLFLGLLPVLVLLVTLYSYLASPWALYASLVTAVYGILYVHTGLRSITGRTQYAAAAASVVFVAVFIWSSDRLDAIPDVWNPRQAAEESPRDAPTVDGEALLFEQQQRLDQIIEPLGRDPAGTPQAFFLGFAGVGEQKVFAQEIALASRVLGSRYRIGARSVAMINDERDLDTAPLATVTSLRYALAALGARMNLERDVLFLSLSSHGGDEPLIAVSNSNLPLNALDAGELRSALQESGIKWRVIVISACYAGGFIDSLKNPTTIVITAAAADRASFGCSNDADLTYFGEAFYRDALPNARSLREAFEIARAAIAEREHDEGETPSNPQAYFGVEIEKKLDAEFRDHGKATGFAR